MRRTTFVRYRVCAIAAALVQVSFAAAGDAPSPQSHSGWTSSSATAISDKLVPVALDQVKVGGEFGRRIQITIENGLLNLDVDEVFLKPFQEKKQRNSYRGLGLLIDASVRLAVHTGDPRILAFKRHLVTTVLKAQDPDGYLGEFDQTHRMWAFIDIQELAYLIHGLLSDYGSFKEEGSLLAARKQADYILKHWNEQPAGWPTHISTLHMWATDLERAMYTLFETTGDSRYRDFCIKELGVLTWDYPVVIGRYPPYGGHIYSYMSRCMAQLEWYRHDPDRRLLGPTRRALDFML